MSKEEMSRRSFVGKTAAGITVLGLSVSTSAMNTASYKRILGANDRINIGFLGCGGRSRGHQNMVKMSVKDKNLGGLQFAIYGLKTGRIPPRGARICLVLMFRNSNIRKKCYSCRTLMP